jgi:CheY-like chemotaxis protein
VEKRRYIRVTLQRRGFEMSRTVLVIDDDEENLQVIGLLLKKLGYTAVMINNGWDALDAIREERPDLILLDLMMRPIDGWQFLDELKKDGLDGISVIIFTAKYVSEEEIAKYRGDYDLLLQRPITLQELRGVLSEFFSEEQALKRKPGQ